MFAIQLSAFAVFRLADGIQLAGFQKRALTSNRREIGRTKSLVF